jgi:hypothetical protein
MAAYAITAITSSPIRPPTNPGSKAAFDPEELDEEPDDDEGAFITAGATHIGTGQTPHWDMLGTAQTIFDEHAGLQVVAQLAGTQLWLEEDCEGSELLGEDADAAVDGMIC